MGTSISCTEMRSPQGRDVNGFRYGRVMEALALHMSWLVFPKEGYMSIRPPYTLFGALVGAALLSYVAVAFADDNDKDAPVTFVGCIMRESDWREANGLSSGGWLNTGAGVGNEYMLLNAIPGSVDQQTQAQANCSNLSGGQTIELKGSGERRRNFEPFVGQRIEVSGHFAHHHTAIVDGQAVQIRRGELTAGENERLFAGPVNPMKKDLRLIEVKVESFREIPIVQETVGIVEVEPEAAAPPEPAPAPAPEPQVQQPAPAAPYTPPVALPKTASPMELMGLLGLLSMGGAFGLRTWRQR